MRKKNNLMMKRSRIFSLRFKFISFMFLMVLNIMFLLFFYLKDYITDEKRKDLLNKLYKNTTLLLNGSSISAAYNLIDPAENRLNLGSIPDQMTTSMEDKAMFLTITSENIKDKKEKKNINDFEIIWGSNDPHIIKENNKKYDQIIDNSYKRDIDTEKFQLGISIINDDFRENIEKIKEKIDNFMHKELDILSKDLNEAKKERLSIINNLNFIEDKKISALDNKIKSIEKEINKKIFENENIYSSPEFNINLEKEDIKDFYIFYKPIIFTNNDDRYFRGLIRLGISTKSIQKEIIISESILLKNILIIFIISIIFSLIVAFILANIIIKPIKTIVKGIEIVSKTEYKKTLKNFHIKVNSKDELRDLAEALNRMIKGIVKAAEENQQLTMGKDMQKQFIPLRVIKEGKKDTTGGFKAKHCEFFGYYEGAKGVSGDYYYYEKIDKQNYAIIKCDISGKGISAGIIMVEVAALFNSFFRDWNKKDQKYKESKYLVDLVYLINDAIASRGYKGKFAALTTVVFNEITGKLKICNAGDTLLHIYRDREQKMQQITLNKCPAAGMFSSKDSFLSPKFIEEYDILNRGDFLLLFTDGIEEAKRLQRSENGKVLKNIIVSRTGTEEYVEKEEEFGIPRIHDLVEHIMSRKIYLLQKENSLLEDFLLFDFSKKDSDIYDVVMGLISVEKIFRQIEYAKVSEYDIINIDIKIEQYLKEVFNVFDQYFINSEKALSEEDAMIYNRYSYMKEDDQYDDLTILAIKKN